MAKIKETIILVMPVYNEELYIGKTVLSWIKLLNSFPGSEILVIDDGSIDKTSKILDLLVLKFPILKIVHKKNEGHGKTILTGYQKAVLSRHEWVFQTDGDGHYRPSDFYALWRERQNSDFILGQRQKRQDPFFRIVLSKLVSFWIFILFGVYIKDTNIPFRLIRRQYLKKILKRIPNEIFAPNIFLSILAKKDGHILQQIPVTHKFRKKSHPNTVKIIRGAMKGFFELLLFKSSQKGTL